MFAPVSGANRVEFSCETGILAIRRILVAPPIASTIDGVFLSLATLYGVMPYSQAFRLDLYDFLPYNDLS
jgi:hypothetical protein